VDTVHECDRRTDGQTDRITITKTVQRIASHYKNCLPSARTHVEFSSVQFSKGICIAQLSRMSHCAPAAREPVRFKFTPEARVGGVLVA